MLELKYTVLNTPRYRVKRVVSDLGTGELWIAEYNKGVASPQDWIRLGFPSTQSAALRFAQSHKEEMVAKRLSTSLQAQYDKEAIYFD